MSEWAVAQVECYSGHSYAQEPRAVIWHDRRYPVAAVVARWRTPRGPAFWIESETGERFELQYSEGEDTWSIRFLMEDEGPSPQAGANAREVQNHDKEGSTR